MLFRSTVVTVTVACAHESKTTTDEKASDCKDQGWDAYSTCDACGQLFNEAGEEISAIPFRPLSNQHTGGTATGLRVLIHTVVMVCLYFMSFMIQQRWVFAAEKKEKEKV